MPTQSSITDSLYAIFAEQVYRRTNTERAAEQPIYLTGDGSTSSKVQNS